MEDKDAGKKSYYFQGVLDRNEIEGPAVIEKDGTKYYYKNGKLHILNGPAIVYKNGGFEYYMNNEVHRKNGPAVMIFVTDSHYIRE